MRSIARSILALVAVTAIVAACGGAGATATTSPTSTPVPTPEKITPPPSTPMPTTPGTGDQHVTGSVTNAVLSTPYARTKVSRADGVTEEIRGGVATMTYEMNDARVSGKATWTFGIDLYTNVGTEWFAFHLATDKGTWDGPCSGGAWNEGDGGVWSCWLTGSGGYAGYTYFLIQTGPANGNISQGVIYPGPIPKP